MADETRFRSVAPVLLVDAIEPCLPFWTERLGFRVTTTVPEARPYVFAIVARDGIEVMLQTHASAAEDVPAIVEGVGRSVLYFTVAALDPLLAGLGDTPVAVARRRTFYGADEVFVRDPAGNVIGLAAFP